MTTVQLVLLHVCRRWATAVSNCDMRAKVGQTTRMNCRMLHRQLVKPSTCTLMNWLSRASELCYAAHVRFFHSSSDVLKA
jgi:hypothetical protein